MRFYLFLYLWNIIWRTTADILLGNQSINRHFLSYRTPPNIKLFLTNKFYLTMHFFHHHHHQHRHRHHHHHLPSIDEFEPIGPPLPPPPFLPPPPPPPPLIRHGHIHHHHHHHHHFGFGHPAFDGFAPIFRGFDRFY